MEGATEALTAQGLFTENIDGDISSRVSLPSVDVARLGTPATTPGDDVAELAGRIVNIHLTSATSTFEMFTVLKPVKQLSLYFESKPGTRSTM